MKSCLATLFSVGCARSRLALQADSAETVDLRAAGLTDFEVARLSPFFFFPARSSSSVFPLCVPFDFVSLTLRFLCCALLVVSVQKSCEIAVHSLSNSEQTEIVRDH